MLRYLTSGESHGRSLLSILDGMPAGLIVGKDLIDKDLARRMLGYGRGNRMSIEADRVEILSGLRKGRTIGSPIAMMVNNADHSIDKLPVVLDPRPGHADLSGLLKYGLKDARDILERASARETAARVCAGAVCKILLAEFGIHITSHVTMIGGIESGAKGLGVHQILAIAEKSVVRCADANATKLMCAEIDRACRSGDTLGGTFEVIIEGVPPGLGSHAQWDRRINGILAKAIMSIQAIKGVSFGMGFEAARRRGSMVHDEILYKKDKGFFRNTNNAGGIEGGITNGEDIVIQAAMKPIATLKKSLSSVNINTKKSVKATVERSDICAVPAAGVVAEAVSAFEIANALIEKLGGDSIAEMGRNYKGYLEQLKRF